MYPRALIATMGACVGTGWIPTEGIGARIGPSMAATTNGHAEISGASGEHALRRNHPSLYRGTDADAVSGSTNENWVTGHGAIRLSRIRALEARYLMCAREPTRVSGSARASLRVSYHALSRFSPPVARLGRGHQSSSAKRIDARRAMVRTRG